MLSVNITKAFGSFRLETQFEVEEGSITAIFGKSGAGKTSTINAIAGLTRPDVGVIQIGNTTLFDQNLKINLPIYKRQIGYVFQDDRLFPHMTVRNNLIYGTPKNRDVANSLNLTDITVLLELAPLLERRPKTLSGGEKQRVAIGRALLSNPKLLLMDEPLASIDVQHRFEILPFIQRVREKTGITIIYVTHALEEVIFLADQIILLSEGQVTAQGTVEEIMSRLDLHPMTSRFDAGAVISATYSGYDREFDLGELSFDGGTLRIAGLNAEIGIHLRAHIRARDVSLMLDKPKDTSVLNVFKGELIEIRHEEGPQLDLLINIGTPLIARITRKSLNDLNLDIGSKVYAMIKAVAIDRRTLGTSLATSSSETKLKDI